ncbi:MAG: acyl--CoA ligase [Verrucomicrobia subdivision 3 bacterium]|nr:acyl--CoA ligase [Verrucomicrobiota bacterium]MCC6821856.1 acyl--CoA ligase [Limisphaerales bacterium]
MNLTELLDTTAARWPKKVALIEESTVVSYAELAQRTLALAAKLQSLGITRGGRIGLAFPNGVGYVALTFALWRVNAVVVPIPMECTEAEIAELAAAMQLEGTLRQKPRGVCMAVAGDCFLTQLAPPSPPDNHGLNLAFIRFTSGTTSARKGVALGHETIRDRVLSANQAFRIGSDDTVIWCLPMAHHFLITIVLYLGAGATIVLARHVLARPFLEAINHWRGTVLYAAPFHFAMLARDNSGATVPSVRLAVSTTCALPAEVAEEFYQHYKIPLVQGLGVIEFGLVSLNTDDPRGRWNSVGRPAGGFRIQINDPDADGCGEVAVTGPGIFDAYVAPWIPREALLCGGWFPTGDIGRLDAEGFLFLLARKTAVINLAGRKVFPEEIEAVINRHPAVRESRVYGKPHAHLGEVVEVEIVLASPDANLDSVRAFCRDHLASYKIPTRFTVVSALPRTAVTGKIRRAAVVA